MGKLTREIIRFGGSAIFGLCFFILASHAAAADDFSPENGYDHAYGDWGLHAQTEAIAAAVTEVKRLGKAFATDPSVDFRLEMAVRTLAHAIDNRGALRAPGPGVPAAIAPAAIRDLLFSLKDELKTPAYPRDAVLRLAGYTLARMAAQDSVDPRVRSVLEKQAIELAGDLDKANDIIKGLGDLGSTGRLSEGGQLSLLHLVLEKCDSEGEDDCKHALRQVRPKSPALVTRILALLNDDRVIRRGQVSLLGRALETEYANPRVILALTRMISDPEQSGWNRSAAIQALLLENLGSYGRPGALRKPLIRDAILACSRMPTSTNQFDLGASEAIRVVRAFPGIFSSTDEVGLTEHATDLPALSRETTH